MLLASTLAQKISISYSSATGTCGECNARLIEVTHLLMANALSFEK
jgi:hypothetical protein